MKNKDISVYIAKIALFSDKKLAYEIKKQAIPWKKNLALNAQAERKWWRSYMEAKNAQG